jgi:hypothetical protein
MIPKERRSMKRLVIVCVVLVIALGIAAAAFASAGALRATTVLRGGNPQYGAIDYTYKAGRVDRTIEAWTRTGLTGAVMFRIKGHPAMKLNTAPDAWTWGLDPLRRVAFQQDNYVVSTIRFYDWHTGTFSTPGWKVNKPRRWQYEPSVSGNLLTFARLNDRVEPNQTTLYLYDLASHRLSKLAVQRADADEGSIMNGQVNSDWADWAIADHHQMRWNVFRYAISTHRRTRIPRPAGRANYSPSVARDGTVFYISSTTQGCGTDVHLMSYSPSGVTRDYGHVPAGWDSYHTFVSTPRPDGSYDVFLDIGRCGLFGLERAHVAKIHITAAAAGTTTARQLANVGSPSRALDGAVAFRAAPGSSPR